MRWLGLDRVWIFPPSSAYLDVIDEEFDFAIEGEKGVENFVARSGDNRRAASHHGDETRAHMRRVRGVKLLTQSSERESQGASRPSPVAKCHAGCGMGGAPFTPCSSRGGDDVEARTLPHRSAPGQFR